MKAMLRFDLPEEEEQFRHATNGSAAHSALYEVDNYLRCQVKYAGLAEDVENELQKVRDLLRSSCDNLGVVI
jgi:hypothetical protein